MTESLGAANQWLKKKKGYHKIFDIISLLHPLASNIKSNYKQSMYYPDIST